MTKKGSERIKRWYDDACGTALAMELVGERWSMLIVRELMFGPRRFGELKAGLGGISANVLTQRLDGLEAAHILKRVKLPPPASVQVYELTPWGYEAEGAIKALGAWAARSPDHDPTLPLSAASMMLSLRTMLDIDRARVTPPMSIGFAFGAESFVARLADGDLPIVRGTGASDVHFTTSPRIMANLIYGKWPIGEAEAAGELVLRGDHALAASFIDLFHLPAKAEVE
ncbi:winged helix-turn-helix transcriptional regulator [Sphingomonas radiodurans]|uniref:winged helix-turn-helix transcriptional regulator n=1 Tax=Sphingomonas radiodurans TaxID=2890321 RepID=UPI001E543E9E|nr:helix-turn-helix domain-containing protein [Sphingomonas radiodurans]WBH15608.1 helix-turn-helix domain-containing protein [Sphingomonas radiodurans]